MKKFITIVFLLTALKLHGLSRDPEWLSVRMAEIEKSSALPDDQRIEILGNFVRIGGRGDNEQQQVFEKARAALLAIPGHAEYFGDQINEVEQKLREETERQKQSGTFIRENFQQPNQQLYAFQTLRELPSPETLRVLGDLLLNEQRLVKEVQNDESNLEAFLMQNPPCKGAMQALARLVEDPPVTGDKSMFLGDLKAWQHWYQQVKEGRRTVRFKGDPKNYSLQGPVAEARNPDVARAEKRPEAPPPQASAHADDKPGSSWVGWLVGILGVIASAFYFHQRSKRAT